MRTLRLTLPIASALLLIAASTIPLLQVIGWGGIYVAAAKNEFYTPLPNAKDHFFDSRTLLLLRPATPYFLLLVLLQCGAAYPIGVLLSRSTAFNLRLFAFSLCLSAVITTAATTVLWMRTWR
jgi:hypothetical protein